MEIAMPGPSFDLSGRTALVTGGGSGLGLAMAEGLAAAGAEVVVVGRDRKKLEAGAKPGTA
jgi:gluconate 5-dehydrogenase